MGPRWRYGIILDAGSSGTRLHVYHWDDVSRRPLNASDATLQSLPTISLDKTEKTKPGVSSFAALPATIGSGHLQYLIDAALEIVPSDDVPNTPIFLMATAGMRLLPQAQQISLLKEICSYFETNTFFQLVDCDSQVRVISGETEGLYGWIAVNYLLGGFDHPEAHVHGKGHHTIGFLDMGGASAQIAFAPNSTEAAKHANDLKLVRLRRLDGENVEYNVFVATWLGFGAYQARERYVKQLILASSESDALELDDPCMPKGLKTTIEGKALPASGQPSEGVWLSGTGDFERCLHLAYPLLGKSAVCEDYPCLLDGKHVPTIDFDVNHFIGISEFWHSTHGVFGGKGKGYDLETYQKNVYEFCGRNWNDIVEGLLSTKGDGQKTKEAQEACFKAAWLISLLYEGIGIPRLGIDEMPSQGWNMSKSAVEGGKGAGFLESFRPVDQIVGVEVSWTLGKMVLHVSGQIPASRKTAKTAKPVGFGSNDARVDDFEESGPSWAIGALSGNGYPDLGSGSGAARVLLGLLLLFIVMAYLLRKRERRHRLYALIHSCGRRHRRPSSSRGFLRKIWPPSKLFERGASGSGGPGGASGHSMRYERVLEEGEADRFELGAVGSDDLEHSDESDGWRTDRLSATEFNFKRAVDGPDESNLGVQPSLMDRRGLVVRTMSRELLSTNIQMLNAGRRSRAPSPSSARSPMASSFKGQ